MGDKLTDRPNDYTFGKRKLRWPWIAGGIVLALVLIGAGSYVVFRGNNPATQDQVNTNSAQASETLARRLDGVTSPASAANLNPYAVIVENHSSVRPQSGLSKAGVVYEALAEGGITRFLAVFATPGTFQIGPVRSARPYFVQLAREYGGLFVHAGTSPQAKTEIQKSGIVDFDQFSKPYNFIRLKNTGRPLEHTLFTDLRLLELGRASLKIKPTGDYEGWIFKADAPAATPSLKPITIDYSTPSYKVTYTYDAKTNAYLRSQAGAPALDKDGGARIAPKNVTILFTTSTLFDALRRNIKVVGDGKLVLFQDGQVLVGTWKKEGTASRLQLLDSAGSPFKLNRGQTWVQVVDVPEKNVSY
ncbi:MAG: DUF3048 domain-containing protein [Patescibacteria group bacterium]